MKKKELKILSELKFNRNDKKNGIYAEFIYKNHLFYCVIKTHGCYQFAMQLDDLHSEKEFSHVCKYDDLKSSIDKTKAKNTIEWKYNGALSIQEIDKNGTVIAEHSLLLSDYLPEQYKNQIDTMDSIPTYPTNRQDISGLQSICSLTIPSITYESLADIHLFSSHNSLKFMTTQGVSILGISLRNPSLSSLLSGEYKMDSIYFSNLSAFLSDINISIFTQDSIQYLYFTNSMYRMAIPMYKVDEMKFNQLPGISEWNLDKIQKESSCFQWDMCKHLKEIDKWNQTEKKKLEEMVEDDENTLPKGAKAYLSLVKRFWNVVQIDTQSNSVILKNKEHTLPLDIKFSSPFSSTIHHTIQVPYQDLRCIVENTGEEDTWGYATGDTWNTLWCMNRFVILKL